MQGKAAKASAKIPIKPQLMQDRFLMFACVHRHCLEGAIGVNGVHGRALLSCVSTGKTCASQAIEEAKAAACFLAKGTGSAEEKKVCRHSTAFLHAATLPATP